MSPTVPRNLHMALDPNNERFIHIFFNLYEFNKIKRDYCDNVNRNNHMLVDEARGTINFSALEDTMNNPAEYFQHVTTWDLEISTYAITIHTCDSETHEFLQHILWTTLFISINKELCPDEIRDPVKFLLYAYEMLTDYTLKIGRHEKLVSMDYLESTAVDNHSLVPQPN
ncbi:uncharacterized protein TNIN_303051 [Trichonephila inaurata madagascariensis]|uniref:Uncharacterized protein n=1 Tax=Trichonephila inaurata madagascariensis TaxID=2747483 RepID=A0A8X6YPB5_9ARAC|nr:uncharacterized protein TNIN_303051 [Trichonephila inaurata madagascariensis]